MIPVLGVENQTIAVLGLGRSGRATAAALAADALAAEVAHVAGIKRLIAGAR